MHEPPYSDVIGFGRRRDGKGALAKAHGCSPWVAVAAGAVPAAPAVALFLP